jgi:hypothetical protein
MLDAAMLLGARVLLRFVPPGRALRRLRTLGKLLPRLDSVEDARAAVSSLRPRGTCLSRSLAIAARAPRAAVVIGVDPSGEECVFAHAWLEIDGCPLEPADVAGRVIAKIPSMVDGAGL